jgi:hypothetical protein
MKNRKLITLIILVLLCLLGVVMYIMNPLTKSEEQIRESLFKETPIGTHLDDVIKYIESQRKWEVRTISHEHGFYHQGISPRREIGEKSIRANLGEYGFIFTTSVTVFWGFDEDSKLMEIWVWKTIDSL